MEYKLSKEIKWTFFNNPIELDNIDDELVEDLLAGIKAQFKDKGKNIAAFFQNLDLEIAAMKSAETRIAARRKALESKCERLKDYWRENIAACGIKKIDCPEFVVTLKAPAKAVEIVDEGIVPGKYIKEVTTTRIDKAAIRKALSNGEEVAGAKLISGKQALLIK